MTTVGYGDVVPESSGGRLIGVFVMVFGVASVSLMTALVTSSFVTYQQRRSGGELERHQELVESLERIEQRLDALDPPSAVDADEHAARDDEALRRRRAAGPRAPTSAGRATRASTPHSDSVATIGETTDTRPR